MASTTKPVKVKMMTRHLECGEEMTIHIAEDSPMLEVKRQLAEATGVPIQHQIVLLSGINQLAMGDRRTHLGARSCGTASSLHFALLGAGGDQ